MSTLRMQNFSIIGQGVPEIQGVTHTQTQDEDLLYRNGLNCLGVYMYQKNKFINHQDKFFPANQ